MNFAFCWISWIEKTFLNALMTVDRWQNTTKWRSR